MAEADEAKHTVDIISFPLTTPLPQRPVITTGSEQRRRDEETFGALISVVVYLLHCSNVFILVFLFLLSLCMCVYCMCKCVFVCVYVHIKTHRGSRWGTECPPLTPFLDALGQGLCVILELCWQLESSSNSQSFLLCPCPALDLQECTCLHLFSELSTKISREALYPPCHFSSPVYIISDH